LFHGIQVFVPGDFYICCKRQKPLFQVIKYFVSHDMPFCFPWYKILFLVILVIQTIVPTVGNICSFVLRHTSFWCSWFLYLFH
jgi:hypothetical protein